MRREPSSSVAPVSSGYERSLRPRLASAQLILARRRHSEMSSHASVRVFTIGHGTRPAEELVETLLRPPERARSSMCAGFQARAGTRSSTRARSPRPWPTPGIAYRHAVELGGRLSDEPGEERFGCIGQAAFRSYAARMGTGGWQEALDGTRSRSRLRASCAPRLLGGGAIAGSSPSSSSRAGTRSSTCSARTTCSAIECSRRRTSRDGKLYLCGQLVA